MKMRLWICVLLAVAILVVPSAGLTDEASKRKLVIVSWDAAADWIVDRLMSEGKMPNVARLAREGVHAEYVLPPFPSITAPGHAALWTAAPPDVNGIIYNAVSILPKSEHTVLETMAGFNSRSLLSEPFWMPVVKSGRKALLLSAAQSLPIDPYYARMAAAGIPKDHLVGVTGRFEKQITQGIYSTAKDLRTASNPIGLPPHSGGVKELDIGVAESRFTCFFLDTTSDPVVGYDTVIVRPNQTPDSSFALKPGWSSLGSTDKFSPRITLQYGGTETTVRFRLFSLAKDGSSFLLYHTPAKVMAFTAPVKQELVLASGGECEVPFGDYQAGKLGKTIWQHGDGSAERRLTELVRLGVEQFREETKQAMVSGQWDLIMHYSPFPDSFEHITTGYMDPESKSYRKGIARKLWPCLEQLYGIHDEWIGEMLANRSGDTIVALVSDHGMQGVSREFHANVALKQAGLLSIDSSGKIDLARTKALAPPWYPAFGVVVNDTSWKDGIVSSEERTAVLAAAENAVRSAVDPKTGQRPVTTIFKSPNHNLSLGGARTVDFAFDLQPDYSAEGDTRGAVCANARRGQGVHGFLPTRDKMHSVFFASGPGLERGATLPPMKATDVIPRLCEALGWPAPGQGQ